MIFYSDSSEHSTHEFRNLQTMSKNCQYVSDIDKNAYQKMLFEIQYMARNILKEMGRGGLIKFRSEGEQAPFFERTLIIALSLAVEHGLQVDTLMSHTFSNALMCEA